MRAPSGEHVVLNPDRWTEPFWAAAEQEVLRVPRCTSCGTFRMPPGPFCPACRSQDVEWVDLPGTGEVFTWTVVRHAVVPFLRDAVPFVIAVVALDGAPGARLIANLVDVADVSIGQRVRVVWHHTPHGPVVPRFTPLEKP